jgi:hypothetical protein
VSFCPETALLRNLSVNQPICWRGVKDDACAQMLDLLELTKIAGFQARKVDRERLSVRSLPEVW